MLSASMFLLQNRSRNGAQARIRYNKYATFRAYFLSRYIFSMICGHLEAFGDPWIRTEKSCGGGTTFFQIWKKVVGGHNFFSRKGLVGSSKKKLLGGVIFFTTSDTVSPHAAPNETIDRAQRGPTWELTDIDTLRLMRRLTELKEDQLGSSQILKSCA